MFGSSKASTVKQAHSAMAFQKTLPDDVERRILSFKDPTRQVGVKGGIKTDSASAMPINVEDEAHRLGVIVDTWRVTTSCMVKDRLYYSREEYGDVLNLGLEPRVLITIWRGEHYRSRYVDGQPGGGGRCIKNFKVSPITVKGDPYYDEEDLQDRKLRRMSRQCEACGPDLELYDMLR